MMYPQRHETGVARRASSRRKGFTLIELLVVLVILGLLAGLVGPQVMRYLSDSKTQTAQLQIEDLSAALDLYRIDVGSYPSSDQGLEALVREPSGVRNWNGPYLRRNSVPDDPWGNPYNYRQPGEHGGFDLWTYGADNQPGGEGENQEVTSWD
ncbi:type II secretion system major pseudopilin GspG [Thioalkalivibrio sp. ALE11]|uniref:type II secretion system major pseudopilin GspG n=1 Tax=Thioalkalivibrio sp. ALE11 TaxID=1265494 RepID=UPI0003767818|nr:type II secretion system major pseudopilin GspG [Thioalkalivibrio sp. ALE11]